ncbi:MAG: phage tail assembly protein [Lachnospiraceae bacterium]|nr:phage tail assembly protein [Lachnospiraceae bacterium]MBO5145458.1 phage tail assembly protein [Lachnospiraceae bacterium]
MDEKNKTLNIEETEEQAAIEAAADISAQAADLEADINENIPYVITLSKTYKFEGEEINKVDLSGLEDLTTADGEYVDRVMAKMNYHPRDKFRDITYTKHIAMKVTNLPIEFFNALKWKDQQAITSRIAVYFLY